MPLLFGYLGLLNCVALAPVLVAMAALTHGRVFENFTPEVFGLVCAKGLFDNVLSDYLWARAVVLTTPTIATVGLSLTIPLAFLSDFAFNGLAPSAAAGCGAAGVVAGFVLVNVGDGNCESRCGFLLRQGGAAASAALRCLLCKGSTSR
mmetsp:Transcript_53532/g.122076  ORF Transcript_53532/g.122076 Transcript_53532/m.122076 type:complete len:149 (+) Transcript_53532:1297-1743(+)